MIPASTISTLSAVYSIDEPLVAAEGVAEGDLTTPLGVVWDDVEMDLARLLIAVARRQAAEDERSGRREGVRVVLALEAEVEQDLGDRRDPRRVDRVDPEVDDALAGQARDRRAAEVLDDQVGPSSGDELGHPAGHDDGARVRWTDLQRETRIRADRRVGHGPSVSSPTMRRLIGRRLLEVDVG